MNKATETWHSPWTGQALGEGRVERDVEQWSSGAICSHGIAESSEKEVKGRQVKRLYFSCNTAGTRVFHILEATLRDSSLGRRKHIRWVPDGLNPWDLFMFNVEHVGDRRVVASWSGVSVSGSFGLLR